MRRVVAAARILARKLHVNVHVIAVPALLRHASHPMVILRQHAQLRSHHLPGLRGLEQPVQAHDVQGLTGHLPRAVGETFLQIGVQNVLPLLQPAPVRFKRIHDGIGGVGALVGAGDRCVGRIGRIGNKHVVSGVPGTNRMRYGQRHGVGSVGQIGLSLSQERVILPKLRHAVVAIGQGQPLALQLRHETLIIGPGKGDG